MTEVYYQQLINYRFKIKELENLRLDAYNISGLSEFYVNLLKDKRALVYVAKIRKEIVAASYVSDALYSLYIEQLFVKKCYQNQHIGSNLLYYILQNKDVAESYFNHPLTVSKLCPASESLVSFYNRLGYQDNFRDITGALTKRL
jgi:GNAT superfamily N-acetyltransferase